MQYLGHVQHSDPLFEYLRWDIFPQLGCDCRDGIRVFASHGSNEVYIYEERRTNTKVVGKFFFSGRHNNWDHAGRLLEREARNINLFRNYISGVHYAARLLGCNYFLNRLLVVEYCCGEPLDSIISKCINHGESGKLFEKLRALAWFLAELHNNSATGSNVDFRQSSNYFNCMLNDLEPLLYPGEAGYLRRLCSDWYNTPEMWQDNTVLVHGDATPSNFFFGDGMHVITFDLERVKWSDRVFDTGRMVGELQHFFLRMTGNKYAAEPFIGHFLWEYASHFPDRDRAFASITRRIPFYMGTTLLRIARNNYLDREYRRRLIEEAKLCLNKY